ncbi:MAG: hypothetical protein ACJ762_13870 [Solirubrobacteraceae bacterium]
MLRISLLALLIFVPTAAAVTPRSQAILENHRHYTGGHDWHVQVEVNKASNKLATVVAYAQECKETGFAIGVPLKPDGSFTVSKPLADGNGSFTVTGKFVNPNRANGTWEVVTPDCTFGGDFAAQDATGHFLIGNPYDYAPDRINGKTYEARHLRIFQKQVATAGRRFPMSRARKLGYELDSPNCPGMVHARKHGTAMWGPLLDPEQPQSLVYWCDAQRHWTLAGMMFRASGQSRPPTYDRLIQWHKHGSTRTATWMTHVWLVRDPIEAFATCAPFNAFSSAGMFSYVEYISVAGDAPCADTPGV